MAKSWIRQVKHIQPGEPVSAAVASRPDRALQSRTDHLRDRLENIETGMALVDFDAAISLDVQEGYAVYWNADLQRYEPALALMEADTETGALVAAASADCLGMVITKRSSKVADVLLCGLAEFGELSNSIGETIVPGRYYLSAGQAGHLTKQRPPVTVPVAYVMGPKDSCSDKPLVFVMPQLRDFQQDHIHYRVSLVCAPAGTHTPPVAEGLHEITDADSALPGWLPADDASFNGTAPPGAVFGYNLSAHTALNRLWPPVPITAVALLLDKGVDRVGATEIPLGREGLAVVNRYGIWWMSNCYGDVPWPTAYDSTSSTSAWSESSLPECPRHEAMRLDIVFIRMLLGAASAVVTDLAPAEGSPIVVENCDGDPATTGSLRLRLNLEALINSDEEEGPLVFKSLSTGFKFNRGLVVEGVKAGSANVTITSTHPSTVDDVTTHQGTVTIDANLNLDERELPTQITALNDAVERQFRDVPYVGFAQDRDAAVTFRFDVPVLGVPTSPQVKFRVVLFGLATGTLPALTMNYKIINRPDGVDTPATIPASWESPAPVFDSTEAVTAYEAIEIESDALDVTAGDTVILQIARDADAGYAGEVALLRCKAILIGG